MDGYNVCLNTYIPCILHYVVGWRCQRLLVNADNNRNVWSFLKCLYFKEKLL